jgi:hypothetical protein
MRYRSIVMTFSMAALFLLALVHAQDHGDELRATERERLRSLVEGDLATARRLHADDFQLINPAGVALSKEQYLGELASGALDYLLWEPGAIEVRRYGDAAAVIRYQAQAQAIAAGQKIPLRRFWHTDVYEKRDGRWQVVWSQATLIQ